MNTPRTTGSTKKLIMWYKIKELFSKGQSYSQISRNLGIDRHRVSQYARMSEEEFLSSEAYCRSYTHKMDAYESFVLNELRSCPSYSSKQIEDHLKEMYGRFPSLRSLPVLTRSFRSFHSANTPRQTSVNTGCSVQTAGI